MSGDGLRDDCWNVKGFTVSFTRWNAENAEAVFPKLAPGAKKRSNMSLSAGVMSPSNCSLVATPGNPGKVSLKPGGFSSWLTEPLCGLSGCVCCCDEPLCLLDGDVYCPSWTAWEAFVADDSYDIVADVTLLERADVPWAFEVSKWSESSMPANVGKWRHMERCSVSSPYSVFRVHSMSVGLDMLWHTYRWYAAKPRGLQSWYPLAHSDITCVSGMFECSALSTA